MDIIMPQLGETVEEGTIAAWFKKVGDKVSKGDLLFEVETDKVTTEIPSPKDGVISSILVDEDGTVPVGTTLAVLLVEGEEESVASAAENEELPSAKAETMAVTETEKRSLMAPRAGNGQVKQSPAVRKLLSDNNLDASQIAGSGDNGRLTRKDVEKFIKTQAQGTADDVTVIPFNRMRLKTAERMVLAKNTAPHVFQGVEINFGNVDKIRMARRADWKAQHGYSLTYLPFIARATCMALKEYTQLNAHLVDNQILVHNKINLGIAVDIEFEGLMVPVLKNADKNSVAEMAQNIHDLAARARTKSLKPDELTEATYTISNSGSFGTLFTAPIINLPQVAIMSTDGVQKKPVVMEMEQGDCIVIQPVGVIAQSFDHRAVDGAYSAAFLKLVKRIIEEHDWSQEI